MRFFGVLLACFILIGSLFAEENGSLNATNTTLDGMVNAGNMTKQTYGFIIPTSQTHETSLQEQTISTITEGFFAMLKSHPLSASLAILAILLVVGFLALMKIINSIWAVVSALLGIAFVIGAFIFLHWIGFL